MELADILTKNKNTIMKHISIIDILDNPKEISFYEAFAASMEHQNPKLGNKNLKKYKKVAEKIHKRKVQS
jgi:hypothetical protein